MRGIEMTYEEFKDEVEALGFKVGNFFGTLKIINGNETVAYVHRNNVGEIDTHNYGFEGLEVSEKLKLLDICYQLAKTPPEEREPVKKYYLKHKFIFDKQAYLAKNEKYFWLMIKIKTDADYQQFTLDEIEEIKEKFGVTLEDWELVEVE